MIDRMWCGGGREGGPSTIERSTYVPNPDLILIYMQEAGIATAMFPGEQKIIILQRDPSS